MSANTGDKNKLDYQELHTASPCVAFKCSKFEICKSEEIACDAYHWYVQTNKAERSRPTIYKRANKPGKQFMIDFNFIPNELIHAKLFAGD